MNLFFLLAKKKKKKETENTGWKETDTGNFPVFLSILFR